jgi:hypothetical protein
VTGLDVDGLLRGCGSLCRLPTNSKRTASKGKHQQTGALNCNMNRDQAASMKRKDVLDIIEIGNAGYSIGAG